jgi:hypothetical protein
MTGIVGNMGHVSTPRIRFSEQDDIMPILDYDEYNNEDEFNEMPRFGKPSVTASESMVKYGSTVKEIVNPYEIVPWSEQVRDLSCNHCSVFVWLLSVLCVKSVSTRVSEDQRKLEIFTKLPSILDKDRIDERNEKCFKDSFGMPLYPSTHIRTVSHKQALGTYARNEKGEVVFKQTIYLPFRVAKDPVKIGDKEGVQIYFFGQQGEIKMLVVELISADSQQKSTTAYSPHGYDCNSVAGSGQHTRIGGGSFYCVNPQTGRPNPQFAGFPRTINTDGTNRTERSRHENNSHRSVRSNSTHRSQVGTVVSTRTGHIGTGTESLGRVSRASSVARLPVPNGEESSEGESFTSTIRTRATTFHHSRNKKGRTSTTGIDSEDDDNLDTIGSVRSRQGVSRASTAMLAGNEAISITQQALTYDEEAISRIYNGYNNDNTNNDPTNH